MTRTLRLAGLLVIPTICAGWLVPAADAQDAERLAMARVRFTTEPGLAQGCARVGAARRLRFGR